MIIIYKYISQLMIKMLKLCEPQFFSYQQLLNDESIIDLNSIQKAKEEIVQIHINKKNFTSLN